MTMFLKMKSTVNISHTTHIVYASIGLGGVFCLFIWFGFFGFVVLFDLKGVFCWLLSFVLLGFF